MRKEKTLFLVHVEEMFREHFPKMYVQRICKALNYYTNIVVFNSNVMDIGPIKEIKNHGVYYQEIDWGWGYEKGMSYDPNDEDWIIESSGHQYTWVPEELRNSNLWENHDISLGGGCNLECLQDMRDVLDFVGIKYKSIRGLIY